MTRQFAYSYTVLRYIHDTTTGEFVNVGVALCSPEARYASATCRPTYGRLSKVFPGVNGEHFRSLMKLIQARIEELGDRYAQELPLSEIKTASEFAKAILPHDDSSLQWSPLGTGRTDDPSRTLEKLYERMVMRYDEKPQRESRTDEDVWKHFKRTLEERQVLRHFQPKKIAVQDDEIEFEYAWKNGVWHCLEPVSFDLVEAESIKDKAHRCLGEIISIKDAQEHFKLYLLVGQPRTDKLLSAFNNAMSILRKIPIDKEIFFEQDAASLADMVANEVALHEQQVPNQ
jgi:hypothetical protein